jgi:hypothetical protein
MPTLCHPERAKDLDDIHFMLAIIEHFSFFFVSLNIKGITMNDFEWYVKWKWVAILLVILLVMALLMHP